MQAFRQLKHSLYTTPMYATFPGPISVLSSKCLESQIQHYLFSIVKIAFTECSFTSVLFIRTFDIIRWPTTNNSFPIIFHQLTHTFLKIHAILKSRTCPEISNSKYLSILHSGTFLTLLVLLTCCIQFINWFSFALHGSQNRILIHFVKSQNYFWSIFRFFNHQIFKLACESWIKPIFP